MPRALDDTPKPEVDLSPALSLMALPGEQGIRSRKIAIVIGDGVDAAAVAKVQAALREAGAIGRLVGPRVGTFKASDGKALEAQASFENEPSVLFDGLVLPGGEGAFAALGGHALVLEYIKDQYRHLKTILAMGTGAALLEQAGVPTDGKDGGLLVHAKGKADAPAAFVKALAKHRHVARDSDPPKV